MKNKFVSLWLCAICILFFVLQLGIVGFTDAFILDGTAWVQPWRFVGALFLHASVTHLIFNLFALILFGSVLESLIGSRKFLLVFFVTGIGANLIAVNFYSSSLGASGAIFGVIGALIIVRPLLTVFAFGLPMPLFVAGILWAIGDVIGVFVPSDVGNIAHLAGLGIGLIFGAAFRNWNAPREHKARVYLDEHHMRQWEDRYLR